MSDFLEDLLGPKMNEDERTRVESLNPFLKARLKSKVQQLKFKAQTLPVASPESLSNMDMSLEETLFNEAQAPTVSLQSIMQGKDLAVIQELREIFGEDYLSHPFVIEMMRKLEQVGAQENEQAKAVKKLDQLRRI